MKKRIILGIMGTIGSGKSTASSCFSKKHWKVIHVDALGHALLQKKEIQKKLMRTFGKDVLKNGKIFREKLGKIVFTNRNMLQKMNKIMHPILKREVEKQLHSSKNIVLDCALLVPLGLAQKCDVIIKIIAPQKMIFRRLQKKYTQTQISFITQMQKNNIRADYVILNSDSKKELSRDIRKIITFLYAS